MELENIKVVHPTVTRTPAFIDDVSLPAVLGSDEGLSLRSGGKTLLVTITVDNKTLATVMQLL